MKINAHYSALPAHYLFHDIDLRVQAYLSQHPDARLLRMGTVRTATNGSGRPSLTISFCREAFLFIPMKSLSPKEPEVTWVISANSSPAITKWRSWIRLIRRTWMRISWQGAR